MTQNKENDLNLWAGAPHILGLLLFDVVLLPQAPFTTHIQGGFMAPIRHLAVLYKYLTIVGGSVLTLCSIVNDGVICSSEHAAKLKKKMKVSV